MLRSMIAAATCLAAILLGQTAATAQQSEFCVRCMSPEARYRCAPQISDELRRVLPNERVLKFACIKDIAKAYRHEKCSVKETVGEPCDGETVVLNLNELAEQYTRRMPGPLRRSLSGAGKPATGSPDEKELKPADPNAPPKTVVEMAKRTAETSNKQIEDAGKAVQDAGSFVGGAVEKSWRCLSSLFNDC